MNPKRKYKILKDFGVSEGTLNFGERKKMPKVSIVIPVYNVEKYLRECLDSVVNQSLRDIEIICINDGSTDNSFKILEEYKSKEIRLQVLSQKNGGQSKARNAGLEVATGEYIYFLDSDDYIKTDALEILYKIAKKLVLSKEERPSWDIKALKECGYNFIKVEEDMGRYVWDERQKVEQKSRPLFMVLAK